ncbi:hypothetical protein DFH06DRAFT_1133838 [Mycena polygramma]|nr:hypothetical protein DFH06DRAFT_1133838 [Mycena polygramma]
MIIRGLSPSPRIAVSFGIPDIEKALLKIDEVASNQEGIAAEEALILPGDFRCAIYARGPEHAAVADGLYAHPPPAGVASVASRHARDHVDAQGRAEGCLEGLGKRVIDRADTVDSIVADKDFGRWVESLLSVADEEHKHMKVLSPLSSPNAVASSYNALLNPILSLFSTTLTSLIAYIKRALHTHAFFAVAARAGTPYTLLARRGSDIASKTNELKDGLGTLRGVCLRSFPEFIADLQEFLLTRRGERAEGRARDAASFPEFLADFVVSAVKYMDGLPEVHSAASAALLQLGDGNWKMGQGVTVGKGTKLGGGDKQVILEHFIYDVVTTAITSLTTISRTQRTARFRPLLQTLTDDPGSSSKGGGGGAKAAVQDKSTRFSELLGEVLERHKGGAPRLLEDGDWGGRGEARRA